MIEPYEVVASRGRWFVILRGYVTLSGFSDFNEAFRKACDLAGWTTQDLNVVGDPIAIAQEVLT